MKSITPKFKAKVINNQLEFLSPEALAGYLSTMPINVDVVVKENSQRSPRSNNQNRYYWGVIIPILSKETGYTKDEVHELLKAMFISEMVSFGGKDIRLPRSTKDLTTVECEEYFNDIRVFASLELSCVIPLPHETE